MLKRVRNKKGFTLIELMIVVAIVGILAAIAIPAYLDYTVKTKLTEVSVSIDALAQSASEYHASAGFFPDNTGDYATVDAFAAVSDDFVSGWTYTNIDANTCNFEATLNLNPVLGNTMTMQVLYLPNTGYVKEWTWSAGTSVAPKYRPKK